MALTCASVINDAAAQEPPGVAAPFTLADALRLAERSSEEVAIARAGVDRSGGERKRARSEYFPQVHLTATYVRTLASEFESVRFTIPDTAGGNPLQAFEDLPFGREHAYNAGLSISQSILSGGRGARNRIAASGERVAVIALESERAQLGLEVTRAYYDAVLSDRLYTIAEATLRQAESTFDRVKLGYEVGNQAEFDLLRARVAFENQRPVVIQRDADRTLAYVRLKQLLDVPLDAPVVLADDLDDADVMPAVAAAAAALELPLDTAAALRAVVRQAEEAVRVQGELVTVARQQRRPDLGVSTLFGKVSYPLNAAPDFGELRTNWTITASFDLPLFTGGRISGDERVARANLAEARARLEQTRELAALDARDALERLAAAEAAWRASAGTVEQAEKAYDIAEVRFDEGISPQLELDDARLMLQQAEANRALAARDLLIARVRVALLPWLPLGAGASASSAQAAAAAQAGTGRAATTAPEARAATRGGSGAMPPQSVRTGGGR